VRWQPYAYNPNKRLAYLGGEDGCVTRQIVAVVARGPDGNIVDDAQLNPGGRTGGKPGSASTAGLHGLMTIADVTTGQIVTRLAVPHSNRSGMLATSGGLVFTANIDGAVTAHDDETLAEVWRFETGIPIKSPPMSYSVGGKQFIAITVGAPGPGGAIWPELKDMIAGAMLYVFAL
jgi:alcohol dehydrogenase (cytochrome c)